MNLTSIAAGIAAVGAAPFDVPRVGTLGGGTSLAPLLGFVVYGVCDLISYSTLTRWP